MPTINITAERPAWQRGLTNYDWSRAKQYYSNPDGTLTPRGFEFLKNVASKNRTGTSNYMRDVNKLSYIPNAAVGAIGAVPAVAGLIASAPVVAEAAAPYVVPTVKSMFGIKNLASLGLSMGVATGVDQTISDNSNYKSLPDWANQTFFDGSPETEQVLEFFRPEYIFAPHTSKVVNKGVGLTNKAYNTIYNTISKINTPINTTEVVNPGMQFIRAMNRIPNINEKGFVDLVPENNMLANFSTDMRAASHHNYKDLYELPSLMFIDESKLKGIIPFSIKPSDTFFEAAQLRNRFKPQDITYWSYDEGLNETARSLGFNVPKTPKTLLDARDAHRATIKGTEGGKGTVSLSERLKKTEQERGDRDLGEKANLLRRQFEQSLYRRPSLEDYKRLETQTGLKADVTESEISKLSKIVDEYKNAKGDVNKIEELYKKYGDDPVITLSDGTSFGHDDLVTLSFGTDNTVGDKLSEMLGATLDHRYDKIYYNKASPIESELMKSIGMGQHPRLINGRVVGAKGVGDMSLEEFNEALNSLRKRLGAKPLAKGGKLIRK